MHWENDLSCTCIHACTVHTCSHCVLVCVSSHLIEVVEWMSIHVLCTVSDDASSKFVFTLRTCILISVSNLDAKRNVGRSTYEGALPSAVCC